MDPGFHVDVTRTTYLNNGAHHRTTAASPKQDNTSQHTTKTVQEPRKEHDKEPQAQIPSVRQRNAVGAVNSIEKPFTETRNVNWLS